MLSIIKALVGALFAKPAPKERETIEEKEENPKPKKLRSANLRKPCGTFYIEDGKKVIGLAFADVKREATGSIVIGDVVQCEYEAFSPTTPFKRGKIVDMVPEKSPWFFKVLVENETRYYDPRDLKPLSHLDEPEGVFGIYTRWRQTPDPILVGVFCNTKDWQEFLFLTNFVSSMDYNNDHNRGRIIEIMVDNDGYRLLVEKDTGETFEVDPLEVYKSQFYDCYFV